MTGQRGRTRNPNPFINDCVCPVRRQTTPPPRRLPTRSSHFHVSPRGLKTTHHEHSKPMFTHYVHGSVSEREESFEVTMTATEMKDDLDQESGDQSKVFACVC